MAARELARVSATSLFVLTFERLALHLGTTVQQLQCKPLPPDSISIYLDIASWRNV